MNTPTYPTAAPTTQAEFSARDKQLNDDWLAVLQDSKPETALRCYPVMLQEARTLSRVCPNSKGLKEMVSTLKWALEGSAA